MSCNDIRFPASAGLGARGAYTIFFDILQFRGTANRLFTVAEITAGLDTTLYETEAAATRSEERRVGEECRSRW